MKRALAKQKRPLILGLLFTVLLAAITFVADYLDARRQQSEAATSQAEALVTGLSVVSRELRAAGAFLGESDRAISRFGMFIDQLSGGSPQQGYWAVIASAEPRNVVPFRNWAETKFRTLGKGDVISSTVADVSSLTMIATGADNLLVPGTHLDMPGHIGSSTGLVPVSGRELALGMPSESLWLVLKTQPADMQVMSGVSALFTLRLVDLDRLRDFAGLAKEQRLNLSWLPDDRSRAAMHIGPAVADVANWATATTKIGSYNLEVSITKPPLKPQSRTWLLLLFAGFASTAFWVAWRAAGSLNMRAGALEEQVGETSGKLRVIHEKESAFFENAGTPQCEVDPATGRFLRVNHAICTWLGYEADELLQKTAYQVSAPEDVEVSHLHVEKAKSSPGRLLQLEKRYLTKGGNVVWGLVTSNLFADPISGHKVFLTTIVDITVRKEADAMRDRLMRELAHRVRNTMQLTDSLARQSAVGTRSAHSYAADFRSRLAALSRAQDILFETNWISADMRELAMRIVKPFDHGKIKVDLPKVELPPQHAQTFALAVHELISRSAERGAVKNGKPVEFTGEFDGVDEAGKRKLLLRWKEPVAMKGRRADAKSFGDSMLKLALPRQFDGEAKFLSTSNGLTYEARLTLPDE